MNTYSGHLNIVYGGWYAQAQVLGESKGGKDSYRLSLPVTNPCRATFALVGKAYTAAGQAGASLNTMAVLQAFQVDMLKNLDYGEGLAPKIAEEHCRASDLALRPTKQMAHAVGHSMAAMVVKDFPSGHPPIPPSGLFGNAVNTVVDRYQEANKQSAAFRELILCRIQEPTPSISHSRPGPSVRREEQMAALMLVLSSGAPFILTQSTVLLVQCLNNFKNAFQWV